MTKRVLTIAAAIILIAALAPTTLNAQIFRDTVYRQNFDSTWSTTTPPTNWQIIYTDGVVDGNDWRRAQRSGTNYYAYLYYSPSNTTTDRLVSPVLDCSDPQYQSVWLVCYNNWNRYANPYTAQIRGSSDGGATYPDIIMNFTTNYGPTTDYFDISTFALGQNDVRIDFYGDGYIWNINYWYVDDFMVYGEWVVEDTGGSLDLEMAAILRPLDNEQGGTAFTPICKVLSNAPGTVIAAVECRITDLSNMQVKYDKVLSDFPIEPGYNTVNNFADFTPEGGKEYKALFVVTNPNDVNEANNNLYKNFTTGIAQEVTPDSVLSPVPEQKNAFKPKANFVEMTGDSITSTLICTIEDGAYNALAYTDTIYDHPFQANEEFQAEFKEATGLADGSYTISFWAINNTKNIISDPVLVKTFGYVGIAEKPEVPRFDLAVSGNVVSYTLAKSASVSLKVYDASGQVVATLASGSMAAGSHTATWTSRPGVYFVKLVTPDYSIVKKAIVLK